MRAWRAVAQRRRLLQTLVAAGAASAGSAGWLPYFAALAYAQDASYPNKPIRIVVGFAPGGPTDIVARALAQKMQDVLGQAVIVENKAGAGSNIASEQVARAAPDGYTLLLSTIANATNMSIYKNLSYDTLRDLAPIVHLMSAPSVLVVGAAVPVNNLAELITLAKAKPGVLTYASSGAGGSPHLAGEMLKMRAGIDITHVPYKGAAPAMADVIAGAVTMGFKTALSAIPQMQAGRLKPIAVAARHRLPQIANVPTMDEAGIGDFEVSSWNGLMAPAKTPTEIIAVLNRACLKILAMPDFKDKLLAQAAEPIGGTPAQFRGYIQAEIDKWARVVKTSGATID